MNLHPQFKLRSRQFRRRHDFVCERLERPIAMTFFPSRASLYVEQNSLPLSTVDKLKQQKVLHSLSCYYGWHPASASFASRNGHPPNGGGRTHARFFPWEFQEQNAPPWLFQERDSVLCFRLPFESTERNRKRLRTPSPCNDAESYGRHMVAQKKQPHLNLLMAASSSMDFTFRKS